MTAQNVTDSTHVNVDGIRLEFRCWQGAGLPIILLHEGLGSLSMWRDFPGALAAATHRPVIAWSRRGHGGSDRLQTRREPDYMHHEAELLLRLMDILRIKRAVLFGHSDGGSIALIAAALASNRFCGLILEAPHVFVEQLTTDSIAMLRTAYQTTDIGRKMRRYHCDPDHTFWSWNDIWLDERFCNWNIEAFLPAITAPALLIQGLDDEYGTLEQLGRIEAAVPGTKRLVLPNCGHSPHKDAPDAVLEAASDFLRSLRC